jgi:hypothetical protein
MNFFIAYFKGFWLAIRKIKMWLLLYLINFLFAILAAIPLSNFLQEKVGKSLAPERLLSDFDYTIFQDFMNEYGDAFSIIMGQSRLIFVFYFFLSIFIVGGILSVFKNHADKFSFQAFWSGCTVYFWRMLRLTFYFLIIHVVILGVFGVLIYYGKFQQGLDGVQSEVEMINAVKYMLPIYLIFASFFFLIQDYAKIHVIHKNPNWLFRSFWKSFAIVFNNFLKTYPLYLLNVFTFTAIFIAFWYFRFSNNMDSGAAIALTFAVGQAFIFARIGTKLLNLGSATLMYQSIMKEELEKETIALGEVTESTTSESEALVFELSEQKKEEEE